MPEQAKPQSVARGGMIASAAVMVSRVFGLIRETMLAAVFGASREYDAFLMAFRIPNLLRDLFAEGALSQAFVKVFKQTSMTEGDDAAWRVANKVLTLLTLFLGVLCALGMMFSDVLVDIIAPGFRAIPGKSELTAELTRVMFPFIVLVAGAAVFMGMLNSKGMFGLPQSASTFFNIGSILSGFGAGYFLAPEYVLGGLKLMVGQGTRAYDADSAARAMVGMAAGVMFGGVCQLLVQLPALWKMGYRPAPSLHPADPKVREVLRLLGPSVIGAAAVQINVVFVNSNFASYLGDKPISWLNYAFRFMQFPIGVFGVALASAAAPAFVEACTRNDLPALRKTIRSSMALTLMLCVPSAVGLAVLGEALIGLIYEHGRFTAEDTHATAMGLMAYALGLSGYAGIKILQPAFVALNDAWTPALVSLASIFVNLVANYLMVKELGYGHVGLALSTSTVALMNCVLLAMLLRRKAGGMEGVALLSSLVRTLIAAALMGAAVWTVSGLCQELVPGGGVGPRGFQLAVGMTTGVLVFGLAAYLLRIPELTPATDLVKRKLKRFQR